jgi:PAS domain-containing protein
VLSNVTAGVIGLDGDGDIDFVNRAAERLLDLPTASPTCRLPPPSRNLPPSSTGCATAPATPCRKRSA